MTNDFPQVLTIAGTDSDDGAGISMILQSENIPQTVNQLRHAFR